MTNCKPFVTREEFNQLNRKVDLVYSRLTEISLQINNLQIFYQNLKIDFQNLKIDFQKHSKELICGDNAHGGIQDFSLKLDGSGQNLKGYLSICKKVVSDSTRLEGLKGPKGDKGDRGEKGERGQDGKPGKDGKDGRPGRNGIDGKNGKDGKPGRNGYPGLPGPAGKNGQDGRDGKDGKNGLPGKAGIQGPPGQRGPQGIPGIQGPPGQRGLQGLPGIQGPPGQLNPDIYLRDIYLIRDFDNTIYIRAKLSTGQILVSNSIEIDMPDEISLDYKNWDCENEEETIEPLEGLNSIFQAVNNQLLEVHKRVCEVNTGDCTAITLESRQALVKQSELKLIFVREEDINKNTTKHTQEVYVPNPIDHELLEDWNAYLGRIEKISGNVWCYVKYSNTASRNAAYLDVTNNNVSNADNYFNELARLTTETETNRNYVFTANPKERLFKGTRWLVKWAKRYDIDEDGIKINCIDYRRPKT